MEDIKVFDTLKLAESQQIQQIMSMNDEDEAKDNKTVFGLFKKQKTVKIKDEEPEAVKMSCKIVKINKYGLPQARVIMVTQKNIYNITNSGSK